MAPRTAKSKKAADVKVTETDVPKKGKGRGKTVEAEVEDLTTDISEKAPVTETRAKRGKRAANDTEQVDNKSEETAPPAKKGRKKVADAYEKSSNGDQSADEMSNQAEDEQSEENGEANGHLIESSSTEGGKKKPAKKELVSEKTEAKPGRGRKKQEKADINESPKEVEEKPKGKGKGRAKAQPKVENETEENDGIDDVVKDKPSKGKKKGPSKVKAEKKEKAELSDKDEQEDEKELEDKPVDEPKKKEPRGKKNQGKKAPLKDEEGNEAEKEDASVTKRRKVPKKDDKAKVESKDEEAEDEEVIDTKPSKSRRGQKKVIEASTETDEEPQDTGEPITKRRRKVAEEKASIEDTKKPPPKNKYATNYEQLDFSNSSKNDNGKEWNFKISSWNVDGIRAWASKGGLDYLKHEKPDILCLQETKCSQDKLPDEVVNLPGYHAYWLAGEKDGYAGVGIYTTNLAMNVQYGLQNEELDSEGRIITAEYEQFYLVNTYVPNSGRKLVTLPKRLQWNEEFRKYIKELDKKKPVIICGDMNVSHKEIDLANPKTNRKNAGFTDEERAGMTDLLGEGFVDTFRHLNPDKTAAYTFWTYMSNSRAKNVGWRLDYFIVSERLLPFLCDSVIRDQVYGSDHCPITLYLHLSTADKPKDQ